MEVVLRQSAREASEAHALTRSAQAVYNESLQRAAVLRPLTMLVISLQNWINYQALR
jgi:hypothetical protein